MRWIAFPILFAAMLLAAACGETDGGEGTPTAILAPETAAPQPTATREAATPADSTSTIGPEAAWAIPREDVYSRTISCRTFECSKSAMEDGGALLAAIEFYRRTEWYMVEFRETGTVDVAGIFVPWRANSNSQYALVNGNPAIIYPEEEARNISPSQRDPDSASLAAAYPNLSLWSTDNFFESVEETPQGGQTFIFQYNLTDGCHACATGYHQRVAFDFASDGTYMGTRLLDVCENTTPRSTPVPSIDVCP